MADWLGERLSRDPDFLLVVKGLDDDPFIERSLRHVGRAQMVGGSGAVAQEVWVVFEILLFDVLVDDVSIVSRWLQHHVEDAVLGGLFFQLVLLQLKVFLVSLNPQQLCDLLLHHAVHGLFLSRCGKDVLVERCSRILWVKLAACKWCVAGS